MVFFKFSGQILKKTIITLQALRFKLNCLNQTCISLKSIMQLTKTIFPDSAIFIEKKRVENQFWRKSEFLWRKKIKTSLPPIKTMVPAWSQPAGPGPAVHSSQARRRAPSDQAHCARQVSTSGSVQADHNQAAPAGESSCSQRSSTQCERARIAALTAIKHTVPAWSRPAGPGLAVKPLPGKSSRS